MEILRAILIVLEAVCSLLLIGVILLQRSKSEGLGLAFGAGVGETLFGSRAGNVLTKTTVILGSVFLVNTIVLGMLFTGSQQSLVEKSVGARGETAPLERPVPAPVPSSDTGGIPPPPAAPEAAGSVPAPGAPPPVAAPAPPAATNG